MQQKKLDQIGSDSAMQDSDSVSDRTKEAEQALQGIITAPQVSSLTVKLHAFVLIVFGAGFMRAFPSSRSYCNQLRHTEMLQ
jgi:hypothetical protein